MKLKLIACAVMLFAGCNEKIAGVTCDTDEDCPGGKCDQGVCFDVLDAGARDASALDASTPDAGPECVENEDCASCKKCDKGACVFQADTEDLKDECAGDCATGFCDGTGACGFKAKGTECRAVAGDCDVAEVCSGDSLDCPSDRFKSSSTVCRESPKDCDVPEKCTGTSALCPEDKFKPSTDLCRDATGPCDVAENCTGNSADCPQDAKKPQGTECGAESCTGTSHTASTTCDDKGACIPAVTSECTPYICGTTKCKTTCGADTDCTLQSLCDLRTGICASSVVSVDCTTAPGALQAAIDACPSAQASTSACYLRFSGTCEKITLQDKDAFIQGLPNAAISPSSAGPAVSVKEDDSNFAKPETTRIAIANLTIRGASGPSGHGIEASGFGGGSPNLALFNLIIGESGSGNGNLGSGISASNSTLSVSASTIQNNSVGGISASSSTLSVSASTIQKNSGFGISSTSGDAQVLASWIRDNTAVGIAASGGSLTLRNCVIANNGTASAIDEVAGVSIFVPASSTSAFEHNTVIGNGKVTKNNIGVKCFDAKVPLVNSIIWLNTGDEAAGCGDDSTSDVEASTSAKVCATSDPGFTADYHLQSASPCIDKVDCLSTVTIDIDGESRPLRTTKCDVGADEVP